MNCCDDFGNCRQGPDCPAREAKEEPLFSQNIEIVVDLIFAATLVMAVVVVSLFFLTVGR